MTESTNESHAASAPRNPYAGAYPGNLFMVVAPSGAGKSTLVNALLARDPAIRLSISYTTRKPRPGEQDGQHYHFTTVDDFLERHGNGEFLESAEVHGNYYATSRLWIEQQMKNGHDVLLEIDWQGAQQVKKRFRPRRAARNRLAGRAASEEALSATTCCSKSIGRARSK